ncbi:MAG: hypothetical protein ACR2J5_00745 [Geodermatophilaceae bacterium]
MTRDQHRDERDSGWCWHPHEQPSGVGPDAPNLGVTAPGTCLPAFAVSRTTSPPQLTTHPDTHIYASLPRVKTLRTARLLAEIGDARSEGL